MPFFRLFRSKEEKLAEAIAELYSDVVLATFRSSIAVEGMLEEKLETTLEPAASYDLRCEVLCFYAHVVDYLSLGTLGERGQNLVTTGATGLSFGIERFVESSLSEAGDPDMGSKHHNFPDFDSLSMKWDLVEHNLVRGIGYYKSQYGFVDDFTQALDRGDVPGVIDASSDEPISKVSRLVQNVYKALNAYTLNLGPELNLLRTGRYVIGGDAETRGFVELCGTIQISVYVELSELNPLGKLQKMGTLIR